MVLVKLTQSRRFEIATNVLIIFNAGVLALETLATGTPLRVLHVLDKLCLAYFVAEILLRIGASIQHSHNRVGVGCRQFMRQGWNVFDVVATLAAFVPGLGALRTLRLLRLVARVPMFKSTVEDLLHACQKAAGLLLLTLLLLAVGALTGTLAFQTTMPEHFGNLGVALITVFGMMLADEVRATLTTMAQHNVALAVVFGVYALTMAVLIVSLVVSIVIEVAQARLKEKMDA
jgi:voltage-gated sodium channel